MHFLRQFIKRRDVILVPFQGKKSIKFVFTWNFSPMRECFLQLMISHLFSLSDFCRHSGFNITRKKFSIIPLAPVIVIIK